MKRLPSGAIVCVALAATLNGCASLADVSAGHVGCRPDQIRITDEHRGFGTRNWVAECSGRRFQCSQLTAGQGNSQSTQTNCTQEGSATPRAVVQQASSTSTPSDNQPTVDRTVVREGTTEFAVVRTMFDIGPRRFGLAVAPVAHPSIATLAISAPLADLPAGCQAGVMIDGQVTPLTGTEHFTPRYRQYDFQLDISLVRRFATAERVVGRICNAEWRLGEREQRIVRELLARCDEEAAWAGPRTSGGEAPPPAPPSTPGAGGI